MGEETPRVMLVENKKQMCGWTGGRAKMRGYFVTIKAIKGNYSPTLIVPAEC